MKQKKVFIKKITRFVKKTKRKAQTAYYCPSNDNFFVLFRLMAYPPFLWSATQERQDSFQGKKSMKSRYLKNRNLIHQAKTFILVSAAFYDGIVREWGKPQQIQLPLSLINKNTSTFVIKKHLASIQQIKS